MYSVQDTTQRMPQDLSHSEEISKVITAVQQAINDGTCPQAVDDAVQSVLNKYRPYLNQSYFQDSVPARVAALHIPDHSSNMNSLSHSNASSLIRGIPFYNSALGLADDSLETVHDARDKGQADRSTKQPARAFDLSASNADEQAWADRSNIATRSGAPAGGPGKEQKQDEKRVRSCSAVVVEGEDDENTYVILNLTCNAGSAVSERWRKDLVTREVQRATAGPTLLKNGDQRIALSSGPTPAISPMKQEKQADNRNRHNNKDNDNNQKHIHKPVIVKATCAKKVATIMRKRATDAAPIVGTVATPSKRGRPFGYRKQSDGRMSFPDGTRVTRSFRSHSRSKLIHSSSSSSSSNRGVGSGDKKRKAHVTFADCAIRKRQSQETADSDGATVAEDSEEEDDSEEEEDSGERLF